MQDRGKRTVLPREQKAVHVEYTGVDPALRHGRRGGVNTTPRPPLCRHPPAHCRDEHTDTEEAFPSLPH